MTVSRDISSSNVYLLSPEQNDIEQNNILGMFFKDGRIRNQYQTTNLLGHPLLPAFFFIAPNTKCVQIWLEQNSNTPISQKRNFFFLTLSSASLLKVTRTGTTGTNPFVPT
ncbi:LOW QUALITY PROTEIN: hypothetical protein PanWU01x14_133750 [Parasponia andersonii]|uniref:Uncharacterized protein n=1 Tax=Parasponia andersonii TaxID=3476 RepID=A0A2P5CPZ3_PARAD|nr:LOW QUALITY PROTEIN: hypothetical protein PanWU01x14_133750 [Parasponia andersonii]